MQTAIQFHDHLAHRWSGKYSKKSFTTRASALLSFPIMDDLHGQKWLDAGCGTGLLSAILSDRGGWILGLDASPEMIQIAAETSNAHSSVPARKMLACQGRAECLPLCENTFDGVLCSSVIEYLEEANCCLSELYRVLKPGGRLIISVPNRVSMIRTVLKLCASLTARCFGAAWPGYMKYSRLEYTKDEFVGLAKKNNFRLLDFRWFTPILSQLCSRRLFASLMIFLLEKPKT
jgi:ubiquinone/menaquinone biosynthesis C-methylase UbiE